jgi:arsenate reductase
MSRKIYYLSTCSTCQRILKEIGDVQLDMQDIKVSPITPEQLEEMKSIAGSYEQLFSRRAMKYRGMGLHTRELSESDYRRLILEEYTFLKRPVFMVGKKIFIGNSKKTVEAAKLALSEPV